MTCSLSNKVCCECLPQGDKGDPISQSIKKTYLFSYVGERVHMCIIKGLKGGFQLHCKTTL